MSVPVDGCSAYCSGGSNGARAILGLPESTRLDVAANMFASCAMYPTWPRLYVRSFWQMRCDTDVVRGDRFAVTVPLAFIGHPSGHARTLKVRLPF